MNVSEVSFDLPKIIARKSKVVRKLVLGVKAKLTSNNVAMVTGEAQIIDKNTVRCGEETYNAENLILCTGSETFIPPITGVETVNYWTHRDALDSKELPASLAIVGGGVIGMEFASFFNSLGVQVTVIEMMDEILGGMDKELSALLRAEYAKRGLITDGRGCGCFIRECRRKGQCYSRKTIDERWTPTCDERFRTRKSESG